MHKYAIEIFYSEEDEGYVAIVPELAGCSSFGNTEEAALKEIMTAIELWLQAAGKEGRRSHNQWGNRYCERSLVGTSRFTMHAYKWLSYN